MTQTSARPEGASFSRHPAPRKLPALHPLRKLAYAQPKIFETAKVGILTAGEQALEMFSEDWEISGRVVDAGVVVLWRAASYVELTA
jgi:hypothetical protein